MYTNIPGLPPIPIAGAHLRAASRTVNVRAIAICKSKRTWISVVNHDSRRFPSGRSLAVLARQSKLFAANKIHPLTENGPSFISRTVTGSRLDRLIPLDVR